MVTIVKSGYSIHRSFHYNENKVSAGKAVCIGAANYPLDVAQMDASMRLGYLHKRVALSQRAERVSIHISLNFSPAERSLSEDKLMEISEAYMQGIGFGAQPYLVYRHDDAGHPHVHIVTTTVKPDGKAINTYMIGKLKSEPVRREIEKLHGLIRAEDQGKSEQYRLEPISSSKVEYGRLETKKAIQNVLENVLTKYRFASLSELNAVLGRYNVMAQQGEEGSRVKRYGGLLYRVLGPDGKPIGVPIRASSFYNRPTLAGLAPLFEKNAEKPSQAKSRVRNAVDLALKAKGVTLDGLARELNAKGIDLVPRKNEKGFVYGLTYVDHVSRCVLNGSELGKRYSAKAVQERCMVSLLEHKGIDTEKMGVLSGAIAQRKGNFSGSAETVCSTSDAGSPSFLSQVLDILLHTEYNSEYIPYELRQHTKRKRKGRKVKR
jgi:hypothetical protein